MSQEQHNEIENRYATPILLLIIGLMFAGSGMALFENAVAQLLIGIAAMVLILTASVLAVRQMQQDPNLNE